MASPADDRVAAMDDGAEDAIKADTATSVAAAGPAANDPSPSVEAVEAPPSATAPVGVGGAGGAVGPAGELGKVTVFNVGMHATCAQLEKLLKANGVDYKRAKKPPSISHATLTFETEAQRASSMEKIGKLRGPRGGEMMKPVLTEHNRKRGAEGGAGGERSKRARKEEEAERRTVAQATASLYGVKTYAEQLVFKEKTLRDDLFLRLPALLRNEWEKRLSEWKKNQRIKQGKAGAGGGAKLSYPDELRCPAWCRTFKRRDGTVPFDVSAMVPSPEQEGYRNKCEFTISLGEDGLATAGFRATRFQEGVPITVESPKDCPQVHEDMKRLCEQMDAFMRSSPFPVYDETSKAGVWRFLLVRRSAAHNETMAKIVVNLTGVEGTEEWKKEEERLVETLSTGAKGEEGTNLVSLWLQMYAGVSSPDETSPLRLVWGKERIEEKLLGLRFTISPNSFFQVNTKGAEALYRVVIENLDLGDDVMVMDVCCGAGTIGICAAAAGGAKRVLGSDLCLPAIKDARRNAEANGIKNCDFVCGKAEDVVGPQLTEARKQHREAVSAAAATAAELGVEEENEGPASAEIKFAAVLDPPRSGVHAKCLRALRATKAVKRLVYVSCNPTKSLAADALLLCSPVSKSTMGMPFRPVKAIPVDMFPHTPHMELVMVFERIEYDIRAPPGGVSPATAAQEASAPTPEATKVAAPTASEVVTQADGSAQPAESPAIPAADEPPAAAGMEIATDDNSKSTESS